MSKFNSLQIGNHTSNGNATHQSTRNGNGHLNNGASDAIDATSPRFRADLNTIEVRNFCFSCKDDFVTRDIHDLMEHYSRFHEHFASFCLYCKTGKVHQYKSERKGIQYYHDCYRSRMKYDK